MVPRGPTTPQRLWRNELPHSHGAAHVLFIPLFAFLANLIKEITIPTGIQFRRIRWIDTAGTGVSGIIHHVHHLDYDRTWDCIIS
jgi:hypothetical protein